VLGSCIYPFDPPSQDYEKQLVVEAFLNDGSNPLEVKLSRSIPIDSDRFMPEENAEISISEISGSTYDLFEVYPGVYSIWSDFQPQTGRYYQLHIQTADGRQYESDTVFFMDTPPIDSVYYYYEERVADEQTYNLHGVQIYVTTHDENNNTWYYRWEFEETWEFSTAYNSTQIWDNGMIYEREEQIHRCWKYDKSSRVVVGSSKNLNEDVISALPVVYISNSTDKLRTRYSILVKQYALSEESYNFWREMENINENLGTLFDPLPYTLKGNIYNIDDENETVLGYFDASSIQEKRIFIHNSELPYFITPDYYYDCSDTVVSYNQIRSLVEEGYMLVGEVVDSGGSRYQLSEEVCIDCTIFGINEEPDFW
jgi:hypothetical protein